jgi:cell division protein FtsL
MKLRKVFIVILSVVSMCGVIFSAKPYDIQAQIKNAIQHIQFVQLLNGNYSANIRGEQSNLKITDTINFLLT